MMNFLKITVLFLLCHSGVIAGNKPSAEIPFELGPASRIYVKCQVNGSRELRFLFDTGATDMVINSNILDKDVNMDFDSSVVNYGATGSNEIRSGSSNSFKVGMMAFTKVPFIAIPYARDQWDGVLGLWFIRRQVTEVNYTDRKIYFYSNGSYIPPRNAIRLKVEYVMGIPVVPVDVTVNGREYKLRLSVDTGSDRVLDLNSPFVNQHGLLGTQKPFAISVISSSDSNSGRLENVIFDGIRFGELNLPLIPGAFSTVKSGIQSIAEMDGVMGNNLLKRFNLVCDLQAGYIYLIPNNLLYSPFYDSLSGMNGL